MSRTRLRPVLVAGVVVAMAAGRTDAFSLGEWLANPPYDNGGTIREQIECYALPYGAIGFASHVLTYLTVLLLSLGRNPLMPWERLRHRRFNLAIATLGFCISFPMTVLTMVRCRRTWPFILIAVWKLVLSVTLTAMTIHAARMIIDTPKFKPLCRDPDHQMPWGWGGGEEAEEEKTRAAYADTALDQYYKRQFRRIWLWVVPYSFGAVVGFVGVMNIVGKNLATNNLLRVVTGAFGGAVLGIVLVGAGIGYCFVSSGSSSNSGRSTGLFGKLSKLGLTVAATAVVAIVVLTVLFAFYTDWALAALAGDIIGRPSSENAAFYWLYFAAKRLPMLSF